MACYQRAGRAALMPVGGAAAAAATSLFLGRRTSAAASREVHRAAGPQLHRAAQQALAAFPKAGHPRRLASSIAKEAEGAGGAAKNGGFVAWYEGHLHARPVATKAITGAILWGVGDCVAQVVPHFFFDEESKEGEPKKEFKYDLSRTGRAVTFGFVIHAPLSHVHYNFLEWMTVKGGFTGLSIPVFKTIMEQFVYWSWFSNSLYHGAMGAMQGMTPTQCYDRIADVLWETQVAQWGFWIPVQLLNFQFVPVRHQLNVVLLTSIVWTALLSAWYPPQEEVVAKKEE
ncbi:hypothetical protein ACHAXT_005360 [Thalassiosira profunda]